MLRKIQEKFYMLSPGAMTAIIASVIIFAGFTLGVMTAHASVSNYTYYVDSTPYETPVCDYDSGTDDLTCSAALYDTNNGFNIAAIVFSHDGGSTWKIYTGVGSGQQLTTATASNVGRVLNFTAGNTEEGIVDAFSTHYWTPTEGDLAKYCLSHDGGLPSNYATATFGSGTGNLAFCDTAIELTGDLAAPPATPSAPHAVILLPTTAASYTQPGVPFRFSSEVCADDYPDETMTAEWEIQRDAGGWTDTFTGQTSQSSFFLDDGGDCDTGLFYGIGNVPDPYLPHPFVTRDYRIRIRTTFNGTDWSDWSDYVEFDYTTFTVGEGETAWGGGGTGDSTSWNDFLDAAPAAPSCTLLSWTASQTGTCVWEWVRYIIIPPEEGFFDLLSRPLEMLTSRWPFVYISTAISKVQGGFEAEGNCPFPEVPSMTLLDSETPTFDVCPAFESLAAPIEDDTFSKTLLVIGIYSTFAIGLVYAVKYFLTS